MRHSSTLGLFCVATLTFSLLVALDESVTPPPIKKPVPSTPATTLPKENQANHDPQSPQLRDVVNDDLYWHIDHLPEPFWSRR